MYRFTPDEADRKRAHHQAVKQDCADVRYEGQFDGTPSAGTLADLRERGAECYRYDVETVAFADRESPHRR